MNTNRGRRVTLLTILGAALGVFLGSTWSVSPAAAASSGRIVSICTEDGRTRTTLTLGSDDGVTIVARVRGHVDGAAVGTVDSPSLAGWLSDRTEPTHSGVFGTVVVWDLAPGEHTWDWYDQTWNLLGSDAWNGPHSVIDGDWRGAAFFRFTVPGDCVAPTTTATPTTVAPTTTPSTAVPTTTIVQVGDSSTVPAPEVTPAPTPSTPQVSTTAVPQTTVTGTTNTLPATGSATGETLLIGLAILVAGIVMLRWVRRSQARARDRRIETARIAHLEAEYGKGTVLVLES